MNRTPFPIESIFNRIPILVQTSHRREIFFRQGRRVFGANESVRIRRITNDQNFHTLFGIFVERLTLKSRLDDYCIFSSIKPGPFV